MPEAAAQVGPRKRIPALTAVMFLLAVTPGVLWLTALGLEARAPPPPDAPPPPPIPTVRHNLDQVVGQLVAQRRLVRQDGYVYAIDVALLSLAAALGGDRIRYEKLVRLARDDLVIEAAPGIGASVVIWRRKPYAQAPPDATGTTEALALAHGLLVGADRFDRSADAELALRLLDGYVKHAGVDHDVWMIRNYYNLQTNSYATNSYLIDYAPDLLLHAAGLRDDEKLRDTARRSARLIRKAQRPNGLIDALVQPEIKTLFPFAIFSPNDVIELEHTALVAEQVAQTAPDVARAALGFARLQLHDARADYVGSTGAPYSPTKADAGTLSAIVRLAVRLQDREAIERIRPQLAAHAVTLAEQGDAFDVHVAAQTLLGLYYIELWDLGQAIPLSSESTARKP